MSSQNNKNGTWELRGHSLGIVRVSGFDVPPADVIYSNVFSQEVGVNGAKATSIRELFPHIRFKKFGVPIDIHVFYDDSCSTIHAKALAKCGDREYDATDLIESNVDHGVFDDVWVPFTENFFAIQSLLKDCGIRSLNKISLSSFFRLQQLSRNTPSVVLHVEKNLASPGVQSASSAILPQGLNAILYPYQKAGYLWLKFVSDEDCGCILGDEMGLGKTLQTITLFLDRKQRGQGPALVVCPVTLLENWRRELFRFAPSLKCLVHHGPRRTGYFSTFLQFDVVVMAYTTVVTDNAIVCSVKWDVVVADEAQNIKNPSASRTRAIKRIPRRSTIAVSGTPFENHISDIWSIVDFALPSFLGPLPHFLKDFPDSPEGAEKIEPLLSSIMIRRRVKDVADDLPKKVEMSVPLTMSPNEAELYEEERKRTIESIDSSNPQFAELMRLRMYCTHPLLSNRATNVDPAKCCTKYERLCEILDEIKCLNEKVILFTSFIDMSALLASDIPTRLGIPVSVINGQTPSEERQPIIDAFSSMQDSALLVLNPRAAATGLNITAANHVIHYNLEWNPALEDQASARAYRRGQTKTVFVHRLYYQGTVEEFVNDKIQSKRDMTDVAVKGNIGDRQSRDDYLKALCYSPIQTEVSS